MEPQRARKLWRVFEPVHAVVYFTPEGADGFKAVGLKGFWMGYFAGRSAPLGAVGPGPVTATFFNFHPAMVARAIPDAWGFATPDAVLEARRESAVLALRRLCTDIDDAAGRLVPILGPLIERADGAGRVLFSANRDLPTPDHPVEALWHLTTCLREHRGDGHVAALCVAGLAPCEALVLFARSEGIPDALFMAARGWSEDEWAEATDSLRARGLVDEVGLTAAGREIRSSVESTTDTLAAAAFSALSESDIDTLAEGFGRLGAQVNEPGTVPYPNPMGLPSPEPPA